MSPEKTSSMNGSAMNQSQNLEKKDKQSIFAKIFSKAEASPKRKKSVTSSQTRGGDTPGKKAGKASKKAITADDENWIAAAAELPTILKQTMKLY
jgi:hypothetical protein